MLVSETYLYPKICILNWFCPSVVLSRSFSGGTSQLERLGSLKFVDVWTVEIRNGQNIQRRQSSLNCPSNPNGQATSAETIWLSNKKRNHRHRVKQARPYCRWQHLTLVGSRHIRRSAVPTQSKNAESLRQTTGFDLGYRFHLLPNRLCIRSQIPKHGEKDRAFILQWHKLFTVFTGRNYQSTKFIWLEHQERHLIGKQFRRSTWLLVKGCEKLKSIWQRNQKQVFLLLQKLIEAIERIETAGLTSG